MIEPGGNSAMASFHDDFDHAERSFRGDVLTVGVINNMPDSALRATERQLCALLGAASDGRLVRLQFYSLPRIRRSMPARMHIARYYEDFADLERNPPDAIIVTGTEPRARSLKDEPYWDALARLIDWAEDWAMPSVWSCLAAHAAVLRLDGIERHALGPKLSGVFECRINSSAHHIVNGLPERWRVPHSRLYGLRESALSASGYSVLSRSGEVGPDIFVRRSRGLQLFLQGHPEYGPSALLGEYRRDVARFLGGERDNCPEVPRHYCSPAVEDKFVELSARARESRNPDLLTAFDALLAEISVPHSWFDAAGRIYANLLAYLDDRRAGRLGVTHFSKEAAGEPHLAA